jgi:hypothetical protein
VPRLAGVSRRSRTAGVGPHPYSALVSRSRSSASLSVVAGAGLRCSPPCVEVLALRCRPGRRSCGTSSPCRPGGGAQLRERRGGGAARR